MNSFYKNTTQTRTMRKSPLMQTKMNQRTRVELFNQLSQGNLLEQKKQAVQQIGERIKCLELFASEQKQMKSQYLQYLQIEIIALQQNQKDILNAQNVAVMQSILIRLPSNQQFIVLNKKGQEVRVETKYFLNYVTNSDQLNQYLDSLQTVQPYEDEYSIYFNDKHRDVKNVFDRERLDDSIRQNAEQISKLNDRIGGNFQTTQSMTDDQSSIFEQSRCQSGFQFNKNCAYKYQNVQSRYMNYTKAQQKPQVMQQTNKAQKTPASSNNQQQTGKQKIYMNPIQQMMRNKDQKQHQQNQKQQQQTEQQEVPPKKPSIQSKTNQLKYQQKHQKQVKQIQKIEYLQVKTETIKPIGETQEMPVLEQQIPASVKLLQIEEKQHVTTINDKVAIDLQPNPLDHARSGANYDDLFETLQTVEDKKEEVPILNIELQTNFAALVEEQRRIKQKQEDEIIELESSNDFDDPSDKSETKKDIQCNIKSVDNLFEHNNLQQQLPEPIAEQVQKLDENVENKIHKYDIINNNVQEQDLYQEEAENPFVVQNKIEIEQQDDINADQNGCSAIPDQNDVLDVLDNQSQSKDSIQSNRQYGFNNDNLFDNDKNEENNTEQPYNAYQQINNQFSGNSLNQEQKQDDNQYDFQFNF